MSRCAHAAARQTQARLRALGLGILIGWRRPFDAEEDRQQGGAGPGAPPPAGGSPAELRLRLNPLNKEAKLFWRQTDQLIVMRRTA